MRFSQKKCGSVLSSVVILGLTLSTSFAQAQETPGAPDEVAEPLITAPSAAEPQPSSAQAPAPTPTPAAPPAALPGANPPVGVPYVPGQTAPAPGPTQPRAPRQGFRPPQGPENKAEVTTAPGTTNIQRTVWVAHVLRRKSNEFLIKNFSLTESRLPIVLVAKKDELRPTVTIRGKFERQGWKLLIEGATPVVFDEGKTTFSIHAHLKGRINKMNLTAVGPNGERENEALYIYAPEAMEFKVVNAWDQILLSVGTSFLSYAQKGFGEYRSISGLLSARYNSPEKKLTAESDLYSRIGLIANMDLTVLTLIASPVDRGPQLLEAKLDGTYQFDPDPYGRVQNQLLVGASYITMFNYGSPFGFSNLLAPEIGWRRRVLVSPVAAWVGEARFIGLSEFYTFNSLALNLSLAWSRLISDSHRLELGFSYSGYFYRPEPEIPVRLHQLSVKLGLSI